jgi:MFS family permease
MSGGDESRAGLPRRLVAVIGAVILVDTMLYAALAPILPALEDEFSLSKAEAGVLVAAYPVGTMLGALPGGFAAARWGPRAVVLAGLALMTVSGLVFALAQSVVMLDLARFCQGLGGAATWTAGLAWLGVVTPRERRGETLGYAIGAGIFGAQFGPVVGAIADAAGRGPTFAAVAALGLVLAALAGRERAPAASAEEGAPPATLARDRAFVAAAWLTFLPSLAFGVAEVLVPLRLDDLGAGALAIGAAFLVAALGEAVMSPLAGRVVDRRGVRSIVRAATLVAAVAVALLAVPESALLVAALLVVTAVALGALWTPSGSLVSLRAEQLGVEQGWAFAVNNLGWSAGVAVGAAAGGALGQIVGDGLPYAICAVLLALTGAMAAGRYSGRPEGTELSDPARALRSTP